VWLSGTPPLSGFFPKQHPPYWAFIALGTAWVAETWECILDGGGGPTGSNLMGTLSFVSSSDDSISVLWTGPVDVISDQALVSYSIEIKLSSSSSWSVHGTEPNTIYEYTAGSLSSGENYDIRVRFQTNTGAWSTYSNTVSATTVGYIPITCSDTNIEGNQGILQMFDIDMGSVNQGTFDFEFNPRGIPDRVQIKSGASLLYDSQYLGDVDWYPNMIDQGVDPALLTRLSTTTIVAPETGVHPLNDHGRVGTIDASLIQNEHVQLIVDGPLNNTIWDMTVKCPIGDVTPENYTVYTTDYGDYAGTVDLMVSNVVAGDTLTFQVEVLSGGSTARENQWRYNKFDSNLNITELVDGEDNPSLPQVYQFSTQAHTSGTFKFANVHSYQNSGQEDYYGESIGRVRLISSSAGNTFNTEWLDLNCESYVYIPPNPYDLSWTWTEALTYKGYGGEVRIEGSQGAEIFLKIEYLSESGDWGSQVTGSTGILEITDSTVSGNMPYTVTPTNLGQTLEASIGGGYYYRYAFFTWFENPSNVGSIQIRITILSATDYPAHQIPAPLQFTINNNDNW
jgi:hypothetical protein